MKITTELLTKLIKEEILKENYSKFKKSTQKRTNMESLNKAVKGVKQKLKEINTLLEYTSRLKTELSEGEGGLDYWKSTERSVSQIAEMATQISNKVKSLYQ